MDSAARRARFSATGVCLAAFCFVSLTAGCRLFDQKIQLRENIELFPTYAKYLPEHDAWECELRGWVFQFGTRSKAARFVVKEWAEGRSDTIRARAVDRTRRFFVDKESDKPVPLAIGGVECPIVRTDEDGIFDARCSVPSASLATWLKGDALHRVPTRVILPAGDSREFTGSVELIAPQGLSIVSDIDDTIRLAEVGDSKKVLERTILQEYEPVPGMSAAYARWAAGRGAVFHYVSGTPLQLFPTVQEFLQREGFPAGSLHLRPFSVLSSRNQPPAAPFKAVIIERILNDFPQRRFIFVGDSGEDDPEMYGDLARAHPSQVEHIYIREVDHGREASDQRMAKAFEGVPRSKWTIFENATQLPR